MIIGDGLIAKSFKKKYKNDENVIIFASGVSNSQENNKSNFERERKLLVNFLKKNSQIKFIYFSTILIDYKNNPYYNHKKQMEDLVKQYSKNYIIFRVPQLIGDSGNSNNLVNYLVNKIKNKESLEIYTNLKRAVIDVEDLVGFVNYCKDKTSCETINMGSIERISVVDLSKIIQYFFGVGDGTKINFKESDENDDWTLLRSTIFKDYLLQQNIKSKGYTEKIINKYIKQ